MPAALDSPSGTLEMKTAASTDRLTEPPDTRLSPRTTDSGTPSSRAPMAMAEPLPACSCSDGWRSPDRFRIRAPRRARARFAARYTTAPTRNPSAVAARPPVLTASSMRSNATAEMRTPEPNAITDATTFGGTGVNQAIRAPMTSAPPPSNPRTPASSQVGIAGPLLVGVAQQVAAEVRNGERDLAALGGVDQTLLDQRVAGGGEGRRL